MKGQGMRGGKDRERERMKGQGMRGGRDRERERMKGQGMGENCGLDEVSISASSRARTSPGLDMKSGNTR